MITFRTLNIIVEIDELLHKSYDKVKEIERIEQLYTDLGSATLVIIRFNPDGYKNGHLNIKSPWSYKNRNNIIL